MRGRSSSIAAAESGEEKAVVAPPPSTPIPKEEARPRGDANRVTFDQKQQPKPLKYNVATQPVPIWKLSSVANFKRRAYLQNIQEQQRRAAALEAKEAGISEDEAGSNNNNNNNSEAKSGSSGASIGGSTRGARSITRQMMNEAAAASANANASANEHGVGGSGRGSGSGNPMGIPVPPEGFDVGVGLPDPMLGLSIANKSMLQSLSNDELKNEMEKMNFNCSLIKNELCALEKFRGNLVWLLGNSSMYKVQRHHNEEGMKAGSQGNPKKRYRSTTDASSSPVAKAGKFTK